MEEHGYEIELRSDEVKEILGTPPKWIVRWGTVLTISIIFMLGMLAYFIKYPDKTPGTIQVTTSGLPVNVNTNYGGYLEDIFFQEGDSTTVGEEVAVLMSDVNYVDYLTLTTEIKILENINKDSLIEHFPKQKLSLGVLAEDYEQLNQSLERYRNTVKSPSSLRKIGEWNSSKRRIRDIIEDLEKIKVNKLNQIKVSKDIHRDLSKRLLVEKNSGIGDKMREQDQKIEDFKAEIQTLDTRIAVRRNELQDVDYQIKAERDNKKQGDSVIWFDYLENLSKMRKSISNWEQRYLIKSPADGVVYFYKQNWISNEPVNAGDRIMAIIPKSDDSKSKELNAEVTVSAEGYANVREGQQVNIKFDSYPHRTYGMIKGRVEKKSYIQTNDQEFTIELSLPDSLITTYGVTLIPSPKMTGKVDILTKERRLLERIFEQFRVIF